MSKSFEDRINTILDGIIAEGPMSTIEPAVKPSIIDPSKEIDQEDGPPPESQDEEQIQNALLQKEKLKAARQAEKEAIAKEIQEKGEIDKSAEKRIGNLDKDAAQEIGNLDKEKMSLVQQIMQKILSLESVDFTKDYSSNQRIISEQKLDRAIDNIVDDLI